MGTAMLKIHPPRHDAAFEPAPRFATESEIALAEELRRKLEERYFGRPSAPAASSGRPGKDH
jgi:hypothetical protein